MSKRTFRLILFLLPGSIQAFSQCIPAFPYQSGWLGGDNALSVPLEEGRVLWLFSDTFVGDSTTDHREGATIIANTAAISTCRGERWEIRYYWKKQGRKAQPLFQIRQKKFKYWPTEAFVVGDTLYVALHKVGPRAGKDDSGPFNFSLVGTTLAIIPRFRSVTPDKWTIRYAELPAIFDPNDWNGAMTAYDGYLYTFLGRSRQKYNLFRVPLAAIQKSEPPVEYLNMEGGWAPGYDREKARVLITGTIGGSVIYHKEIDKWVMVYGPNFLSNEILIRTADQITGPWSDAKLVLKTPEQTPGSDQFNSTYFCYCAREQPAFYNQSTTEITITYDCNSTDFSRLINTLSIYSPRVIRIRLNALPD